MGQGSRKYTEKFEVAGDQVVATVEDLYAKGNARRVVLRDQNGKQLFDLPLNAGVLGGGALLFAAPLLAGVAAVAAVATKVQVEVIRDEPAPGAGPTGPVGRVEDTPLPGQAFPQPPGDRAP